MSAEIAVCGSGCGQYLKQRYINRENNTHIRSIGRFDSVQ